MNRTELEQYILSNYIADADLPWGKYPGHEVLRHSSSRKWFALLMTIPQDKLGLPDSFEIDVVNLKCDPNLIGSLLLEPGIYKAYHMNKEKWISVVLDGTVSDDLLKMLVSVSYELTSPVNKTRKAH